MNPPTTHLRPLLPPQLHHPMHLITALGIRMNGVHPSQQAVVLPLPNRCPRTLPFIRRAPTHAQHPTQHHHRMTDLIRRHELIHAYLLSPGPCALANQVAAFSNISLSSFNWRTCRSNCRIFAALSASVSIPSCSIARFHRYSVCGRGSYSRTNCDGGTPCRIFSQTICLNSSEYRFFNILSYLRFFKTYLGYA